MKTQPACCATSSKTRSSNTASPSSNGPDAELRLALALSHLLGVAIAREIIGIPQLANRQLSDIINTISPTIQRYLDP